MEFEKFKKLIMDRELKSINNLCSSSHKEWPNIFDFMRACSHIGIKCRIYNRENKNEL